MATGRLDDRPYSEGPIACFIKAASAFYEYLKSLKKVIANPFKAIVRIKVKKKLPRNFLKEAEMNLLLQALAKFDQAKSVKEAVRRYKTHVIAELLYSTGLRIREAARLTLSDIDFELARSIPGAASAQADRGLDGRVTRRFIDQI